MRAARRGAPGGPRRCNHEGAELTSGFLVVAAWCREYLRSAGRQEARVVFIVGEGD